MELNLTGTTVWYNELGSMMSFETDDEGRITGFYETKVGDASGKYILIGRTDIGIHINSRAIGFVVVWNNETGNSDSVTAWSGQVQIVGGELVMVTTWLLTSECPPSENWSSTIVGKDTFRTTPPNAQAVERALAMGVKHSHPM